LAVGLACGGQAPAALNVVVVEKLHINRGTGSKVGWYTEDGVPGPRRKQNLSHRFPMENGGNTGEKKSLQGRQKKNLEPRETLGGLPSHLGVPQ